MVSTKKHLAAVQLRVYEKPLVSQRRKATGVVRSPAGDGKVVLSSLTAIQQYKAALVRESTRSFLGSFTHHPTQKELTDKLLAILIAKES